MLFPPVLHNFRLKHYLLPQFTLTHSHFKGSCVTQGGTVSYKEKMKSLYILTKKCPDRHKDVSIIYICYTINAPIPKTLMFSLLHEWKIQ